MAVLAIIVLTVPFASAAHAFTGHAVEPLATLGVETSLPQYSKSSTITFEGRTKPQATVHVFVNDVRMRAVTTSTGLFRFVNVPLTDETNVVRVEAREGEAVVSQEFTVIYDGTPPVVKLDKELPDATRENSLTVSGDVNEKVTIYHRMIQRTDLSAPVIVPGLRVTKTEKNAVELAWDPSTATDLKEYLITRNNRRIAMTALTSFRDENLESGKTYAYGVSAVDTSCNIGESADATGITQGGGNATITPSAPTEVNLSCEPAFQTMSAGSPFSITFTLIEGINDIEIIFEDAAGNQETISHAVRMDHSGPKFLETNLAQLSPSYIPEITIKGRLDEQATVFVYINDEKKPSEFEVTDKDGSFNIRTHLRTDVRIKKGAQQRTTLDIGEGWVNKIRLEAVDLAGNKAEHGPVDIDFLICGAGTWWQANIGEVLPTILLPRLMVQGVQQIGIPFNVSYLGSQTVKLGRVQVMPIMLAPAAQEDYDHNWITVSSYSRARGQKNSVGYVQVQFSNVDPLPDKPAAGPHEKERALSEHRKGECLVPGTGCVKLFLQMEIRFQEIIQLRPTDPNIPIVTPQIVDLTQKVCLPIEVAIDQVLPTDVIPKGLLRNAISLIDQALTVIDKVLQPLTTIGEYVLYGCMGSLLWSYVQFAYEKWACDVQPVTSGLWGSGTWNKAVAEAGVCEQVYKDKVDQRNSCMTCQKEISSRKKFMRDVMQGLCDRIGCPSAPAFSSYIKSQSGNAAPIALPSDAQKNIAADPKLAKWAIPDKDRNPVLYAGNDCAFASPKLGGMISPTYTGTERELGYRTGEPELAILSESRMGIRELYNIATGKPGPKRLGLIEGGPTAKDCTEPVHPAHPNCCGIAYKADWSSACGPGTVLEGLDFFDELKESTCLSAQQANADTEDLKCNFLWNSVAGFCEKNTGQPEMVPVNLESFWTSTTGQARPNADGNLAYLFVVPVSPTERGIPLAREVIPAAGGATGYRVMMGYVDSTPSATRVNLTAQTTRYGGEVQRYTVGTNKLTTYLTEVTECFGEKAAPQGSRTPEISKQTDCVWNELCQQLPGKDKPYSMSTCEHGNIRRAVEKVNDIVLTPDTHYIVDPKSGFLRSIQCVCIPAVVSYLTMWKRVLGAFHGCFSKILLTGEGSEGFCAARLSAPICDLLYEFISCFVQKYSTGGISGRVDPAGGFGNILGVLTGAGTEVSKSVNERYGGSPVFQSLFNERKLAHAICTWAFTGTWDLNIQGLFQQQVDEIPVATEGALTTCERTFIAYDPTTSPSGLTTWAYRVAGGLIAGAELDYRLKLKCSSGFNCDQRDYPDGKCDCQTQERVITVGAAGIGQGRARKYDLVNFDAPFVIQAQDIPNSDVRYDSAILEWSWTDPQTKTIKHDKVDCYIRTTDGGQSREWCTLDLFSGKFRCLFGEMESGIKIIDQKASYPEGQDAFALTQPLKFSLDIKQRYPEERRLHNSAKKFMVYDIRDASGKTIARTDGVPLKIEIDAVSAKYDLSTDGTYRFFVPKGVAQPGENQLALDETPIGSFVLDEQVIKNYAGGPAAAGIKQETWGARTRQFVKTANIVGADGKPYPAKLRILIDIPKFRQDPTTASYDVYAISPSAPAVLKPEDRPGATQGWMGYAGERVGGGKQSPGVTNRATLTPGAPIGAAAPWSGFIEFDHVTGFMPAYDAFQILIEYNPPTAAAAAAPSVCTKPTDLKKEPTVVWTAVFTIYDADRNGVPTEQISTDPDTGDPQQRTVAFSVKCLTADQVKAAAAPTAAAATTVEKAKADARTILNTVVTLSKLLKPTIETQLTVDLSDPAKLQFARNQVGELIKYQEPAQAGYATLVVQITPLGPKNTALKTVWPAAMTEIKNAKTQLETTNPNIAKDALQKVITQLNTLLPAQEQAANELAPSAAPTAAPTPTAPAPAAPQTCDQIGGRCEVENCEARGGTPHPEATGCPPTTTQGCCVGARLDPSLLEIMSPKNEQSTSRTIEFKWTDPDNIGFYYFSFSGPATYEPELVTDARRDGDTYTVTRTFNYLQPATWTWRVCYERGGKCSQPATMKVTG